MPPPPPPFPPRFGGPPQMHGFPPEPFRGLPPPSFLPPAFPPFPSAFPPPPPWQQLPQPAPLPWRPLQAGEGPSPPPGSSGNLKGAENVGSGEEEREEAWLLRFASRHRSLPGGKPPKPGPALDLGLQALEALRCVAKLSSLCKTWRERGDEAEAEEISEAEATLKELREAARPLRDGEGERGGEALGRRRKKRLRRRRQKQEARAAREEEQARLAEEEARIERWRARRAQEVEERRRLLGFQCESDGEAELQTTILALKRTVTHAFPSQCDEVEKELKAAADSVLSEVRKKQADTKRMAEILRGLEKLRKLRKEAAGRKGVCPPAAADEAFENEVQSLRASIKKRTELYDAEERALRVMLEGEQEEERKRDLEKKQRKEREKLLQQKREMDSKLFGDPDEFPLAHILKPFTQYYLQAEYSVPALIQIRHEWDRFLVPADHPEGHGVPPGWVLPSPPSSDIWATAVR